jgi:hypothetical protein
MERHTRRVALLQDCRRAVDSGPCCTPYPFVAALQELEVEEDVCGAAVPCHSQVRAPAGSGKAGGQVLAGWGAVWRAGC